MTEPLTLKVRDPEDLAQQLAYHRLNALARSLQSSHLVRPETAARPAPHATRKGNTAGSAEAARLEELKLALENRHWRLSRARNVGSVASIEQASRGIDALERQIAGVKRKLAEIDTSSRVPAGVVNLYEATVPGLNITGYVEAIHAPEHGTLDTHGLTSELRAQLNAYLLSGRNAPPYRYKRTRQRYWPNPECPEADRLLFQQLYNCTGNA